MTPDSALLPPWFVIAETPGGPRWIYDVPDEMRALTMGTALVPRSDGGVVEIVKDVSGPTYSRESRVVADHRLGVVTWVTKARDRVIAYDLRDNDTQSVTFPLSVTPEQWDDNCTGPEDCDDQCVWCASRYRLYAAVTEPVEGETRSFDFSGYVHLAGNGIDLNPEYRWDAGPQARMFPDYLHHLMPGILPGVWEAVAAALSALPHVVTDGGLIGGRVYTSGDEISLTVRLPLDKPRERWVDKYGPSRRSRAKQVKQIDTHVDKRITLRPPRGISGQTKAAAVEALTRVIAECVERVNAAAVVWCTSCDGNGYTVPDPTIKRTP